MHPTEILDYYRDIEIYRMLNPGRKIILPVNHSVAEYPPARNIKKIYPVELKDESGIYYICPICKDNEQPDMRDYRYDSTGIFLTVSRLRHHYSRYHKQLVKIKVVQVENV